MDSEALDARFAFAHALVEEAAALALSYFVRLETLTVRSKGLQDLASEADLDVEVMIRGRLQSRFPEDAFLGEETGRQSVAGTSPGIWVVDPIDGTQPFVNGMSSWCVSLAYVADGVLEMGFVAAPVRREVFAGRRGQASTLNGRPIAVKAVAGVTEGMLGVGYSPRLAADGYLAVYGALIRAGAMPYRDGSGALMLCAVACGRLIGYVERHINSWDCLGAIAVVEGAGGRVSPFLDGDGLWSGNSIIAASPMLYPALEALVAVG